MKKILLLILSVVCLTLGSCNTNPNFKVHGDGLEVFDLEPGEELVSANYDAWGGYYSCVIRKSDSGYIPQEKTLVVYGSITGNEKFSVIFREH